MEKKTSLTMRFGEISEISGMLLITLSPLIGVFLSNLAFSKTSKFMPDKFVASPTFAAVFAIIIMVAGLTLCILKYNKTYYDKKLKGQ